MKTQRFEIVTALSEIAWTGKKVTGAHDGTIGIKEGSLTLKDNQLVAGKIIIDTTTIRILDIDHQGHYTSGFSGCRINYFWK
jgi:hypothetical protein